MSRWKKILLIIGAIIIVGFGAMSFGFAYPVTEKEANQQFIVSNPLNLTQIAAFSQYRSCAGHDFRDPTIAGKRESTPRSMKHYIKVRPEFRGTIDKVSAFAPFDGKISVIDEDLGGPNDQQVWLAPDGISPRQWHIVFFHINLDPNLKEGSLVTAGQKIGTANLARGPEGKTDNFDFAIKLTRPMHRPAVDFLFNHMTTEVLAEYEEYGIKAGDLIIPEEVRDAKLCPLLPKGQGGDGPDIYFPPEAGSKEYIFLKK